MRSNARRRRRGGFGLVAVLGGGSLVTVLIPARFELSMCTRADGGCLYIRYGAQPASARAQVEEDATQGASQCAEK